MSRYFSLVFGLFLVAIFIREPALADNKPLDAEILIKKCETDSYKDAKTTVDLAAAARSNGDCLEEILLSQVDVMFKPDVFSRAEAREALAKLRTSVTDLYRAIYMEHRGCPCGTMWSSVYPGEYNSILQEMIRSLVKARNDAGPRIFQAPAALGSVPNKN